MRNGRAGTKTKLNGLGYLATMQPTSTVAYATTRRRSGFALVVRIVLIAGAVLLSMRRLASDILTTVAGIAGFLAITYGLVIQIMALINNREPDD